MMNYKKRIMGMLEKLDTRKLKLAYWFIRGMLKS